MSIEQAVSSVAETVDRIGGTSSERLRRVQELRIEVEALEDAVVAEARLCGWTWQEIGADIGITKQAAHQRFG